MKAIVWFKYAQLIFNKYLDKSPEDHLSALFYLKGLWVIAKQNNFAENYPITFNRINAFLMEYGSVDDDDIRIPFNIDAVPLHCFIGHLKEIVVDPIYGNVVDLTY